MGGKTRNIAIQPRFAVVLQNKLHVFGCPFFRTLSIFCGYLQKMTIDTLSLNVIGFSTKFILHVIVLQSSLIVQPSSSVWDIPEHEDPAKYTLSNPRHNDAVN